MTTGRINQITYLLFRSSPADRRAARRGAAPPSLRSLEKKEKKFSDFVPTAARAAIRRTHFPLRTSKYIRSGIERTLRAEREVYRDTINSGFDVRTLASNLPAPKSIEPPFVHSFVRSFIRLLPRTNACGPPFKRTLPVTRPSGRRATDGEIQEAPAERKNARSRREKKNTLELGLCRISDNKNKLNPSPYNSIFSLFSYSFSAKRNPAAILKCPFR